MADVPSDDIQAAHEAIYSIMWGMAMLSLFERTHGLPALEAAFDAYVPPAIDGVSEEAMRGNVRGILMAIRARAQATALAQAGDKEGVRDVGKALIRESIEMIVDDRSP